MELNRSKNQRKKVDWRNECIFCGKKKTWNSCIWIFYGYDSFDSFVRSDFTVTVCPECRKKHTIAELYGKIVRLLLEEVME